MAQASEENSAAAAGEFVVPEGFTDISGSDGVYKKVLVEGQGSQQPSAESNVFVHYTGTLYGGSRDGEKFDSSRDRNEPFSFKLGTGQVIKAWDIAVATMRLGEECDILLKPEFGYGASGSGAIPPNACLKFNIQLLRWEGEDVTDAKDKGVIKHRIAKGEGYVQPKLGSMVTVELVGYLGDRQIESRNVTFEIGVGEDSGIVEGLELAIKSMNKGEKARFELQPGYAFGAEGNASLGVPPDSPVDFEIHLVDFEKVKESWELSEEEKVQQAELLKAKGTEYFKKNKLKPALSYWERAVEHVKWDTGFEDKPQELQDQRKQLLLAARLNISLVQYKLNNYQACISEADEALQLQHDSAKALFRRGQAKLALKDYEEAKADFLQVASIEPGNKAAHQQVANAKQLIAKERQRQKQTFYGMFDKFAKADSKKEVLSDKKQHEENGAGVGDESSAAK